MFKGCTWVQTFGTSKWAETNLVTFTEFHIATEHFKSFVSKFITGINDPSVSLHEDCGPQVVLWMPPVRRAGWLAAGAKYTLIETVQKLSFLQRLQVFSVFINLFCLAFKEWFNWLVLRVEVRHIDNQVFQDEHHHKGRNRTLFHIFGNSTKTGQMVTTVNIHWTWATNSFSAWSSEWQSGVNLILDFD